MGPPSRALAGAPAHHASPRFESHVGSYVTRWNIGRRAGSCEDGDAEFRFPPPPGFSGLGALFDRGAAAGGAAAATAPSLPLPAPAPAPALFHTSDPSGTLVAPIVATVAARPWLRARIAAVCSLAVPDVLVGGGAESAYDSFAADDADEAPCADDKEAAAEEEAQTSRRVRAMAKTLPSSAAQLAVSTPGHLISVLLPRFQWGLCEPSRDRGGSKLPAAGRFCSRAERGAAWLAVRALVRSPDVDEWPALACRLSLSCVDTGDASWVLTAPTAAATAALKPRACASVPLRADTALQRIAAVIKMRAGGAPPQSVDPLVCASASTADAVGDATAWLSSVLLPLGGPAAAGSVNAVVPKPAAPEAPDSNAGAAPFATASVPSAEPPAHSAGAVASAPS